MKHFIQGQAGWWECVSPAEIDGPNGNILVMPGSRFFPDTPYMGVDLVACLDEAWEKSQQDAGSPSAATSTLASTVPPMTPHSQIPSGGKGLVESAFDGIGEQRAHFEPLLQSAEAACEKWRRLAEYYALSDNPAMLSNARWELGRCQTQRDTYATALLMRDCL